MCKINANDEPLFTFHIVLFVRRPKRPSLFSVCGCVEENDRAFLIDEQNYLSGILPFRRDLE